MTLIKESQLKISLSYSMDKRLFIKTIRELLGIDDFKPNSTGAGGVSLVRNNEEISITYRKYPGIYQIRQNLMGFKSFPQVEDILRKYYKLHNIGLQNDTIYTSSRRIEEITEVDIADPEDIEKILPQLKLMVYEDILPFFEKYDTLEKVNSHINTLDKADISKFIFHPPIPRMMIIKRLTNSPDFETFCTWAIEIYEKMAMGSNAIQHAPINKFLPDLYEELKSM